MTANVEHQLERQAMDALSYCSVSDNVSVVIQGVLMQILDSHNKSYGTSIFTVHDFDFITTEFLEVTRLP